jgi:hypothetical protein
LGENVPRYFDFPRVDPGDKTSWGTLDPRVAQGFGKLVFHLQNAPVTPVTRGKGLKSSKTIYSEEDNPKIKRKSAEGVGLGGS